MVKVFQVFIEIMKGIIEVSEEYETKRATGRGRRTPVQPQMPPRTRNYNYNVTSVATPYAQSKQKVIPKNAKPHIKL